MRVVASWGIEVGWRGHRKWRQLMESLQYEALRKCTGTVLGASKDKVSKIAAVESVECFAGAARGRFLARAMGDPSKVGDLIGIDPVEELAAMGFGSLEGKLSWGGPTWRGDIEVIDLGCTSASPRYIWQEAIREWESVTSVVYTDGSMDAREVIGGGWFCPRVGCGCVRVGPAATVWDGEIAGIRMAFRMLLVQDTLVLTDSAPALQAVVKDCRTGHARTRDLC